MSFNLLTLNQSTGTDALGTTAGWSASGAVTLSSSSTVALEGTKSLLLTVTGTSGNVYAVTDPGTAGIPVTPGVTYRVEANSRKSAGSQSIYPLVAMLWYQANGSASAVRTEDYQLGTALSTSAWGVTYKEAVAPSDAAYCQVHVSAQSSVTSGDLIYFDKIGLWVGPNGTWEATNNLLTLNQATGTDTLGTTSGWWASTGDENTIASSTAVARSGARSLSCTAVSTNPMYARSNEYESTGWAVTPGDLVNLSAWSRWGSGNTTVESFFVVLDWYNSSGTYVSTASAQGQTVVAYSASWQQSTLVDVEVPAGVAKMGIRLASWGSITTGKIVHWDDIVLTKTTPATVDGVADYQLTENYAANSDTPSNLVVDGTGSTGTVTLDQTSGTTASVSESPTGVFTITNPTGTDNLVFELTATSDTADMVEFTWTRGGGVTNPIYASEFVKQSDNSWSPTIV